MDYRALTIHPHAHISSRADIIGNVVIGKDVSVFAGATLRGDCGSSITVGDQTNIQEGCCIHVSSAQPAIIGKGVTIGHGAIVHGCTVGDNTLIGMGSTVMDAAVIGNDCIVGAGALVTGGTHIPNGSLVIGSPARVKRQLSAEEIESNRKSALDYVRVGREMQGQGLMRGSIRPAVVGLSQMLEEAAQFMKERMGSFRPSIGVVLGSGLNSYADKLNGFKAIPFSQVPYMCESTAAGHRGQFVFGTHEGQPLLIMQGRIHGYEANSSREVAFPIWLMRKLGVHTLITTNAAGALNESYRPGDFCIMEDHINLTGRNPLIGTEPNEIAGRFVSMKDAYDANLRKLAVQVARKNDIMAHTGIYLALLGPSLETPAEIRLFQRFGADTVAMSVVEEVIAARHVGMRVLGISLITNMGCGIADANPNDEEVHEVGQMSERAFERLISGVIAEIA